MIRRSHTRWLSALVSLVASLTMLAAALGCGSGNGEPVSSKGNGVPDGQTTMPRGPSLVWNASPPPISPAVALADLPLLGLDGAAVPVVDDALASYHMLRMVAVMNLDGEVFPCGCSDGQVGGLVTLIPKLDALHPALVAGLGDNYLPRSIPSATAGQSAEYFNARMALVQAALARNRTVVEVLSPAEAALAGVGEPSCVVQRISFAGRAMDLVLGRAERWSGLENVGPSDSAVLRLLLLGGENLKASASFTGLDRALWFRSPMSSVGLPPNVSLIARPPAGGRGAVVLSLLFPPGPAPSGSLTMLDEVRTLRTAIARTAAQGESATEFRGRLEKRAASLLASRPILLGIQQVAITTDDPVEPELYARYAAFLAQHGAASSHKLVADAGNFVNAKCATCHAE